MRRPGGGAGRRRQFGRPGGGLSGQPGRRRSGCWCAASSLGGDHVALSGRAHRGAAEHRGADRHRGRGAGRPRRQARERALAQPATGEETPAIRSAICSCSSAPIRTPTGWRDCGVTLDAKGFVRTGAEMGAARRRWRPTAAASSPSATCAPARSSASRRRSAKARRWWRRCTPIWRKTGVRRLSRVLQQEDLMADECKHAG